MKAFTTAAIVVIAIVTLVPGAHAKVCRETSDAGRQCIDDLGSLVENTCRKTSDAGTLCTDDL